MKRRATRALSSCTPKLKRSAVSSSTPKLSHAASTPKLSRAAALGLLVCDLGEDLVKATVICRPSARNRSPYVGDVRLADGRVAIAHMPSLDMGGKCLPGTELLVKPAYDRKGNLVGPDALGKYGTPKCEFICQLLRVKEAGVWIGAHPSIGEKIADALLRGGALTGELGAATSVQREVSGVAGTDMRCDFLLTHGEAAEGEAAEAPSRTVLEVKTVVDADCDILHAPASKAAATTTSKAASGKAAGKAAAASPPSAIFPWGGGKQIGPDGEKVVSARAIKHVRELTALAKGERVEANGERLGAAVLFIVVRSDCASFRPNAAACPSFARYLKEAHGAGVRVLAHRVRWGEGRDLGKAYHDGALPVDLAPGDSGE